MSITYTNKNGRLYYLCSRTNENGKRVYFLSRKPKGNLVDEMPSNYEIDENKLGIVTLRKKGKRKNKLSRNQPKSNRHPNRSARHLWQTINKPITQRKIHRSGPPMKGGLVFKPSKKKFDPEPFECGWCYEPIWRVLQSNGYYRYYDDKSLTRKHKCTRPVHWRPDKG